MGGLDKAEQEVLFGVTSESWKKRRFKAGDRVDEFKTAEAERFSEGMLLHGCGWQREKWRG